MEKKVFLKSYNTDDGLKYFLVALNGYIHGNIFETEERVFKIKEEAFRIAQSLGLTKNGKPIFLGKKDIGYKPSDFTKKFQRIKRELEMVDFQLEIFKERFKDDFDFVD